MSDPIAYAAVAADGSESVYAASLKEQAEAACRAYGWFLVPLYAQPPDWAFLNDEIVRLRLTDAEREAIERQAAWLFSQAKNRADIHSCDLLLQEAATLRGLLERMK